jgi:uncharacterized membrane protein
MKPKYISLIAALFSVLAFMIAPHPASAQTPVPVVQVVLFYSPTCGHCTYVITEVLPPIFERYGEQLQMVWIDVTQPGGRELFLATLQKFGLERSGVPFLVVGDVYLYGEVDIPAQFPGLIDSHLAEGGVGWPELPGLAEYMAAAQSTQEALLALTPKPPTELPATSVTVVSTTAPVPTATPGALILTGEGESDLGDRLRQDPVGNGLAILVLIGILVSVGWGTRRFLSIPGHQMTGASLWVIPALCVLGLGVAGYLSYVETLQVEAFCGLVGDCNTVQQSDYARLFGILPIGLLGMAGYLAILAAWAVQRFSSGKYTDPAALAQLAITTLGTLFSIYLTFLEPFVIGATCAWCLASAVIMTVLMLLSIPPGKLVFNLLLRKKA